MHINRQAAWPAKVFYLQYCNAFPQLQRRWNPDAFWGFLAGWGRMPRPESVL